MCLDCDEETPFIYNNTCKANCDEYYGYDENKICYLCSEKGLWYQDEQCVESCGISYKHNNENNNSTNKIFKTLDEQIEILKSKGLVIDDVD